MHVILVLQLLVLQLALQLLRLGDLAHRPVEIVLVDTVPLRLERKKPASTNAALVRLLITYHMGWMDPAGYSRFRHHVPEISTVQPVTHLDHALKVEF